MEFTFHSTWGIFSPRDVDAGSRLLIEYMEVKEDDICLDLGCGYGPIGLTMAKLATTGQVYMVDTNFVAVEYAQKNAQINSLDNCKAILSNAFSHIPEDVKFDVIASNIPANVGREMLSIILSDAKEYLKDSGRFYVVTISGLRDFIKKNFRSVFGNYKKVKQGRSYAVAMAIKGLKQKNDYYMEDFNR
ncbi:methyltransferase [Candidatus Poribacteria bacterium]|nr:methyltransferase [Candidatus Poribacteria bacterium]